MYGNHENLLLLFFTCFNIYLIHNLAFQMLAAACTAGCILVLTARHNCFYAKPTTSNFMS